MWNKAKLSYYSCDQLPCGFFYSDSALAPVLMYEVYVPLLRVKVNLRWLGYAEDGLRKLVDLGYENVIFPVNLFDKPYRIDPFISRTVDEHLLARWRMIVNRYGRPRVPDR